MNNFENSEKIKVIYILSTGRSGSTILDILLGNCQKVWTVGEVFLLDYLVRTNANPCGCLKAIVECDFWLPFLKQNFKKELLHQICKFRDQDGHGKLIRYKYLKEIFGNKKTNLDVDKTHILANEQLFQNVLVEANKRKKTEYIVDSSKDMYRLISLQKSGLLDLRVIHLSKSAPNFVYSLTKPNFGLLNTLRSSLKWLLQNYMMSTICKRFFKKSIHIKYEDLVSNPKATIAMISEKLDLNIELTVSNFRSQINHGVAGNMARFKSDNIVARFDYKEKLPKSKFILSKIIASPLNKRLGY